MLIGGIDGAQDVGQNSRSLQKTVSARNHVISATSTTVLTVRIMEMGRAIDGHTDQEILLSQESRPFFINEGGIRLNGMSHLLTRSPVLVSKFNNPAEERQPPQRRLAALPQHHDLTVVAGSQELHDVIAQGVVVHLLTRRVVQQLLRQEEAVLTVQIACCTCRLCNH